MNWTQEQRDEMIRLWDHGRRSYSEIAKIMGVTKNAIVGRMRREKKLREIPIEHKHAHRSRTNKVYQPREKKMLTLPDRAEFVIPAFKSPPVQVPDEGQLASIIDVTGCRWPVKDDPSFVGGMAFCNHATEEGVSYCPYHQQINTATYSKALIRKTINDAVWVYNRRAA